MHLANTARDGNAVGRQRQATCLPVTIDHAGGILEGFRSPGGLQSQGLSREVERDQQRLAA